uniref:ZP domain-containing protein n=1 Tax=Strongyloides papillosus TaxID=174720 RepID=A0A0N5B5C8_STREA
MKLFLFIVLIFNIFHNVESSCYSFTNYNLLGKLFQTNTTTKACQNNVDKCSYVSLNIPGLVIGSFSGCLQEIGIIFGRIAGRRLDVNDIFGQIYIPNTDSIDMKLVCQRSTLGNGSHVIETITGDGIFFVHCYNQGEIYDNPLVRFDPPAKSADSVTCFNGIKLINCLEGYCGAFELSYIDQVRYVQISSIFQLCPNDLFNQMYVNSQFSSVKKVEGLHDDLPNAGNACVKKLGKQTLSKNGSLSYFWYVNCLVPNNSNFPKLEQIPDLMLYTSTTTQLTTTTKGISSIVDHTFISLYVITILKSIF